MLHMLKQYTKLKWSKISWLYLYACGLSLYFYFLWDYEDMDNGKSGKVENSTNLVSGKFVFILCYYLCKFQTYYLDSHCLFFILVCFHFGISLDQEYLKSQWDGCLERLAEKTWGHA